MRTCYAMCNIEKWRLSMHRTKFAVLCALMLVIISQICINAGWDENKSSTPKFENRSIRMPSTVRISNQGSRSSYRSSSNNSNNERQYGRGRLRRKQDPVGRRDLQPCRDNSCPSSQAKPAAKTSSYSSSSYSSSYSSDSDYE